MNRRSASDNGTTDRDRRRGRTETRQEVHRLERDSFILLQHAYTLAGADPNAPVNPSRLGCDLGFAEEETSRIVRYLNWVGYLKESAAGPHLALAEEAIDYLESGRGRRCSVRAGDKDIPIPVLLSR